MTWFSRISRWGDVHLVYGQNWQNSCGLASVLMCVFKVNKLRPGATVLAQETAVRDRYAALQGSPYNPATTGTGGRHIATILGEFTGRAWTYAAPSATTIPRLLVDSVGETSALGFGPTISCRPVILGVDWPGGGGHWIVVDSIRAAAGYKWATVCDPWDTNLHIVRFELGSVFSYDASDVVRGVDFGSSTAVGNQSDGGVQRTSTYTGSGTVSDLIYMA